MNAPSFPLRRPRIGLATDSVVPSGVGEHMLSLAQVLRERYDVVVAFPDRGQGAQFLDRADAIGLKTQALPSADPERAYRDWLSVAKFSLLHVHAGIAWEGHALGWVARQMALPVVRTEHLPYVLTDADQQRDHAEALAHVDRLIVVSQASGETYRAAGFPSDRLIAVQNGIAAPIIRRRSEAVRETLGLLPDDFSLLMVARFTEQKGHTVLIEALREVVDRQPDRRLRLLLAGDGPHRGAVERAAHVLGLADHVAFLGERDDIGDLLAAADLFVLPSLFEGLPLVILEAMACRLPVVATRIGGTTEALGEAYAWLAEPGDPLDLARLIVDAMADPSQRAANAAMLHARYRARFRVERMAAETAAVYQSLIPSYVA